MVCGCTDKNLNSINNKRLNIDDMKNMSIDEIIKLYREGYRLDSISDNSTTSDNISNILSNILPDIKSMIVASPSIQDMAGFYNSSTGGGEVQVLWNNAGSCGWIRLDVAGTSDFAAPWVQRQLCANTRVAPMLYGSTVYYTGTAMEAFGRLYTCGSTSNDACNQAACAGGTTPSCTNQVRVYPDFSTNLPLYTPAIPNPPTNLQVTEGDKQLTFTWTPSDFQDPITLGGVFTYAIGLYDPTIPEQPLERFGNVRSNITSYTFSNLTNGKTYRFEIIAISRCGIQSSMVSKTGVPTGPVTGFIHFAVTTSDNGPKDGFSIYIDGSPTAAGTTNTNGEFTVEVSATPTGTSHSYRISKQYYSDRTGSVTVIAGQTVNVSWIMQRQTGTIHFAVTSGGSPVQGATVNVDGTDRGTTISDGTFDVTGLYIGYSHQYSISKTYFTTTSGTVILDSTPKTENVVLTRLKGTLHFAVTSGGSPLANVAITVDTVPRGTTLSDGTLDVPNLDMGIQHSYSATLTGYNPTSGSVTLDTTPKTVSISMAQSTTTGTLHFVVTSGGTPLANVSISVDNGTPGLTNTSGILDVSGLAMNVSHAYTATKTGYNPVSSSTILDTTPKTVSISMTIATAGTGSIRFHVNCAGVPCQGAQIWITGINKGQTGIDGTLLLTNLPIGGLNYTVRKSGYQDATGTVIVSEGTIIDADAITLTVQVVQAGAGGAGMIAIAGLVIGALYIMTRKKGTSPT